MPHPHPSLRLERMKADQADIGDSGLAQAYTAWQSATSAAASSGKTKDLRLPGLDYTPEQLFFLSYARIWAQLTRPATAVSRIRTDPHSPPYWRATGTLRNLKAFHEAFGCKAGSRVSDLPPALTDRVVES